ncbi:MAG: hypothetical protein MOIL_01559 [Candidatus Methanolliviera sp. GoM_oil]|nr:MAG: hypothetical protein MOIL_01559 [Candidatus Methanolliviera sp. GoM_oil]
MTIQYGGRETEEKMPKVEPFELFYDRYERWFEENRYVYLSELSAIKYFIPDGRGVEIGVGSGRFASPLKIDVGVDPSQRMRELSSKRGIKVYDGIGENIPFEDASFDYALMVTTICFLDDVQASFNEVNRILKPRGYFIIGFVDKESSLGKKYSLKKEKSDFYRIATFYSTQEVIDLLEKSGFIRYKTVQTIFGDLGDIFTLQDFEDGHGKGSFVVIKASKRAFK